jgi:hypothetical protein
MGGSGWRPDVVVRRIGGDADRADNLPVHDDRNAAGHHHREIMAVIAAGDADRRRKLLIFLALEE